VSRLLIDKYLTELAKLQQVGGTHRESVVREAFRGLLNAWGRTLDLTFIPEYAPKTNKNAATLRRRRAAARAARSLWLPESQGREG
jgi:hypothetical protein